MAPVKSRRSLPTVIDRGLGLLEIILPRGGSESDGLGLSGQRDDTGFWFPSHYRTPGDIFTPEQRRMQDKQRTVQRRRHVQPPQTPSPSSNGLIPDATPSVPHAPPAATALTEAVDPAFAQPEEAVPMPPLLNEAAVPPLSRRPQPSAPPAPSPAHPPATIRSSDAAVRRATEPIRRNG